MSRSFRFAAAAALAAVAALALSACGGSKPTDPVSLLKQTFSPGHSVKSGKLTVGVTLDTKGLKSLKGPVLISLTGPFQTRGSGQVPAFDVKLAIITSGANITAGLVSTGDKGYVRLGKDTFALGPQQMASLRQAFGGGKKGTSLSSLGIKPLDWLSNPRKVGEEKVAGVDTYHVTAQVDVAKFLDDVNKAITEAAKLGSQASSRIPPSISPAVRAAISQSVKSATFDLWTGKDDRQLRRLTVRLGIAVPQALQSRAGGLQTGTLNFGVAFAERNKPQTIKTPANARPYSDLAALQGGGATAGTGGATTTPAPAPSASTGTAATGPDAAYYSCMAKAGNDVAKMQQCAALVGK